MAGVAHQEGADVVGELDFQSGLRGSGQPVDNAITVGGNTESACNEGSPTVSIVFRLAVVTETLFAVTGKR